ncbi:MAG: glycosyltransferase [Gemmatimonadota bacterium]
MSQDAPISIVHVLAPAPFGGMETVVETLAAGQQEAGDAVRVVAILSPGDPEPHPFLDALESRGVGVDAFRLGGRDYRGERRAVRDVIRASGADVLHTHGYRPDVVVSGIGRRLGLATASTVHGFTGGGLRNRMYEWLQTRSFRRIGAVVVVSDAIRERLLEAGVPGSRISVLRNAWSASSPAVSRAEARDHLGIDHDGPVAAFVGRLSAEKGPDLFVRAFASSGERDLRASVVGDGPMKAECERLSEELGVGERMTFHGSVSSVGRYLKAFDVVGLTSWTEGTPMLLLEAMYAEVPLVATAVGGVPGVLSDTQAILCPAGDVAEIGRAFDDVITDRSGASTRAAAARSRLERDFAVEPWVDRYRSLYLGPNG